MKYLHLRFDSLPRIMYSHSCVLKKSDSGKRNNPYYEITFFEEGKYQFKVGGETISGEDKTFILTPANMEYNIRETSPKVRMSCVAFFFDPETEVVDESEIVFERYDNHIFVRNEGVYVPLFGYYDRISPSALGVLRRIIEENNRGGHYTNVKCANWITELVLLLAAGAAEKLENIRGAGEVPSNQYYCARVEQYLRENFSRDINLTDVARYVGLHPNYVSSIFKQETGSTIMGSLRKLRMEQAKRLLLMQKYRIREIARMVGFSDENYFSSVFRRSEGCLPSNYSDSMLKKE